MPISSFIFSATFFAKANIHPTAKIANFSPWISTLFLSTEKIKEEIGIQITVINPRFLTGLDIELLEKLKKNHTHILTLEDGELVSGYGQNIASYYGDSDIKVKNYGISKVFHTDYDPIELLAQNGMSVENLSQYIQENI